MPTPEEARKIAHGHLVDKNRKLFHFYYTVMLSLSTVLLGYMGIAENPANSETPANPENPANPYAQLPDAPTMDEVVRHVLYEDDGYERMYAVEVESAVFVAIEAIQHVFIMLGCLAHCVCGDVVHGQVVGEFSAEMRKLLDGFVATNLKEDEVCQNLRFLPDGFDVQATAEYTANLLDSVYLLLKNSSIEFVRAEITSYQTIGIPSWNVEDVISQFRQNVSKCVVVSSLTTTRSMDPDDEIANESTTCPP
jgi:hypothetical protein